MTSISGDTTLPAYEAVPQDGHGPFHASDTSTASTSAVQLQQVIDHSPLIGGSGVRIPLSETEKEREDLRNIGTLSSYGLQTWVAGNMRRYSWDPCLAYREAVSQLDILLPLLSPSPGTLPATTSLRTITLRIRNLPPTDLGYFNPQEGRDEISRALKNWLARPAIKAKAIFHFADLLVTRIRMDGFTIVEEWWNFGGEFVQFVMRC